KLASNENPLGPGQKVMEAIQSCLPELARYPDGNGFKLKAMLAESHGVVLEQITLGNGSNDILELLARTFLTPEHEVVFSAHAFAVYPIVTQAVGAKAVITPTRDWGHDLQAMAEAITDKTRLIFIANPNNPTGTCLGATELQAFLKGVPENIIVVLDEAYFDYAHDADFGRDDYPDGIQWLAQYPNLVVTRTFSKAYGLAGLRIGYGVSHPQLADLLNRVRQPFNVNSLAMGAACVALEDRAHLSESLRLNREGMARLESEFTTMGLSFIPSSGNFIAVDVGRAGSDIYEALLYEGVIVRPVANYNMPNHIRVTVGLPEENERFITALRKVLGA
ncbi:MAG: histidinol-phosphate transaminase, partial [Gammaproteobacteria bacterium]|nr:histidinol-phosphate transaminase [Gammaproteobacteria bacterium]